MKKKILFIVSILVTMNLYSQEAYDRGTFKLTNGEAFITYSEVFGLVINPSSVTITLTPHSADTYGLAVIEKNKEGFRVKELKNGEGNFSFDWEVIGMRKGYEDYQTVRPVAEYYSISNSEAK